MKATPVSDRKLVFRKFLRSLIGYPMVEIVLRDSISLSVPGLRL
jgi:hypothetical protein